MDLNTNNQSLWVVLLGLFLTYSLPKIVELFVKRFGEPKVNIDTANIENTLKLYETLSKRHESLENKYQELEHRCEILKEEVEELERENARLKGGIKNEVR